MVATLGKISNCFFNTILSIGAGCYISLEDIDWNLCEMCLIYENQNYNAEHTVPSYSEFANCQWIVFPNKWSWIEHHGAWVTSHPYKTPLLWLFLYSRSFCGCIVFAARHTKQFHKTVSWNVFTYHVCLNFAGRKKEAQVIDTCVEVSMYGLFVLTEHHFYD